MPLDRINTDVSPSTVQPDEGPPLQSPDFIRPPASLQDPPSQVGSAKNLPALPHNSRFPTLRTLRINGDEITEGDDTARYVVAPESGRFMRPWLAIPGEIAFVWPVGVQGFNDRVQPNLTIHKFIGSNRVRVDVMHVGEEHLRLTGAFPGTTSPYTMNFLRDMVLRETPKRGKILFLPLVLPKFQYVVVEDAEFDHAEDDRFHDITYSISFLKVGTGDKSDVGLLDQVRTGPASGTGRGTGTSSFTSTDRIDTLRKASGEVYGSEYQWGRLWSLNQQMFVESGVPQAFAPDYRLPIGTVVNFE